MVATHLLPPSAIALKTDSLLGSTERAEVNDRQIDRLLSHGRPSKIKRARDISGEVAYQFWGLLRGMNACQPRLAWASYRSSS